MLAAEGARRLIKIPKKSPMQQTHCFYIPFFNSSCNQEPKKICTFGNNFSDYATISGEEEKEDKKILRSGSYEKKIACSYLITHKKRIR